MSDILLTHAYFLAEDEAERRVMKPYPPLGLLYISAHLKRCGFAVEVLDTTFLDPSYVSAEIDQAKAPIVGIYVNLITRRQAVRLVAAHKARGATVILGGPEPVNYAEEYLSHGADIIVAGEGELTLAELIPHLRRHGLSCLDGIHGIVFRGENGEVRRTQPRAQIWDLDSQPFPDRTAIDLERYLATWQRHHGIRSVSLITARGCPYACNWCSHSVYGRSHRRRSPSNVADEIEFIRDAYSPDQLWFADDVFTINHRWLVEFAAEMKRRRLKYPFETITREDRLNERVADVLAELGCYRIWVGAESGSQRILDAMTRRTSAARTRDMIGLVQRKGMRAGTFIMLGYDGETWSDIDETARHLRSAVPDDMLTTLSYPIKGTPYYDSVAGRIVSSKPWSESSDRALAIIGRNSRRFYGHAQHWLAAETRLAGMAARRERDIVRYAKAKTASALYRLAMYATRHEVERG